VKELEIDQAVGIADISKEKEAVSFVETRA
jgi:hypothetical protein